MQFLLEGQRVCPKYAGLSDMWSSCLFHKYNIPFVFWEPLGRVVLFQHVDGVFDHGYLEKVDYMGVHGTLFSKRKQ